MADGLFRKTLGALRPVDDIAQAYLRDCSEGDLLRLDLPRRPRNPQRHRLYWALLSVVVENSDHWPSTEALHWALKLHHGLVEDVIGIDGEVHLRPKSISFAAMSEEQFSAYLSKVVDTICTRIIPGLDPVTLRMEAEAA